MGVDVIVIGAGVEGLVAAAHLARSGRRVLVVERAEQPGGLCAGQEFHSGYRHIGTWHDAQFLQPRVVDCLALEKVGLTTRQSPRVLSTAGDTGVWLDAEGANTVGEASGWAAHHAFLGRVTPLARSIVTGPSPDLSTGAKLLPLAQKAVGLRRLGKADMLELLRIGPSCLDDFLGESFSHPTLRAGLMLPALHGTWMGPRSPQSTALYLLRHVLKGPEVVGGPAALVHALVAACASAGVEIQCGASVAQVRLQGGSTIGVTLTSGAEIDAPVVLSSIGPRETLLGLIPPLMRDPRLSGAVKRIRTRGAYAKVHLALSQPLTFTARREDRVERAIVAGDPLDIERSFDDVKYRRLPRKPVLDIRVPTVSDSSLAPEGHTVVSIATVAGSQQEDGWTESARRSLGVRVLEALAATTDLHQDHIVAVNVVTPLDSETQWGHHGGHPMHGELALDQLWALRPTPSLAQHHTVYGGLFLGSTGSAPGMPTSGLSGLRAAQAVLD